jgi:transcriptional regulator with XRE-family HTH domain
MTDFRFTLGRRIKAQREAAGYRQQRDFARALGISPSDLSRIERGLRGVDTVLLRRIADTVGGTMDSLLPSVQNEATAFARRGDADGDAMKEMVDWASRLRADIDRVSEYLAGSEL